MVDVKVGQLVKCWDSYRARYRFAVVIRIREVEGKPAAKILMGGERWEYWARDLRSIA